MSRQSGPAFVIEHLLSEEECQAWIRRTEEVGYAFAPVTTDVGPVEMPDVRNNERVMFDDDEAAQSLFQQLRPLIPNEWLRHDWRGESWDCVGLNERLRFYRYEDGQRFTTHRDGAFVRHPDERSFLTLLVYLNAPQEGGATRLFTSGGEVDDEPQPGRALVFPHRVLHAGTEVTSGRKYVLRSDVMYRRAA